MERHVHVCAPRSPQALYFALRARCGTSIIHPSIHARQTLTTASSSGACQQPQHAPANTSHILTWPSRDSDKSRPGTPLAPLISETRSLCPRSCITTAECARLMIWITPAAPATACVLRTWGLASFPKDLLTHAQLLPCPRAKQN